MSYNTFKEIRDLTKNRVNYVDADDQVDGIINDAINHAYVFGVSPKLPTFSKGYATVINGIASLPDDLYSVEKITPALLDSEYIKGNSIISDREGTFEVLYTIVPTMLAEDTDEPQIPLQARYVISTYACAEYFAFKKKLDISQYYLGVYEKEKKELYVRNNVERNVIDSTGGW